MKKFKLPIIIVSIIIILLIGISFFTAQIPTGSTGIKTRFGSIVSSNLSSGLNFKLPIEDIILIDNKTQKISVSGNAASKDLQVITYEVALNFKVLPNKSADLYTQVGDKYNDIIVIPNTQETIKDVVAKYTAEESITNRSQVSDDMVKELESKLSEYGIAIDNMSIIDFDFTDEFNSAIEAKQTAQQDALRQLEENKKKQAQNDQKLKDAEATAEANRIVTESITPELIEQQKVDKWDGKLPTVSGSSSNIIDIGNVNK